MFSHILCPIDGSETAFRVTEFAVKFAQREQAKITILYVVNERNLQRVSSFSDTKYEELIDRYKDQGKMFFQAVMKQVPASFAKSEIKEVIVVGEPADEIIKYAENNGVNLIIMPTKDEDHSVKYNIGHVTDRVIQSASMPVMAIPYSYLTMIRE